jgi:hypothetical protein
VLTRWVAILLQETEHHPPLSVGKIQGRKENKNKIVKMKGVFWNSSGFKDPKKHKFVSDLTKEN